MGENGINLDLIKIIQVNLKIYELRRLPHLLMDAWVGGQMGGHILN